MNYGALIRDTFWIAWRNRYLWFFGLFAGGTSLPSFNFDYSFEGTQDGSRTPEVSVPSVDPGLVVGLLIAAVLILLLLIALSVVSHGGLADSVAAIDRGERRSFRSTWREGRRRFWRVLGLGALLVLAVLAALLVVALPLVGLVLGVFALTAAELARVLAVVGAALLAIAALILVFVPIWVIAHLALRELVLRDTPVIASARAGWLLFRRNFGRTLLLLLIQIGIAIGAAIALFVAVLVVGLVLFLPAILLAVGGSTSAAIVAAAIGGAVLLVLFLIAAGAVNTFHHAYWTVAYLRLTQARGSIA